MKIWNSQSTFSLHIPHIDNVQCTQCMHCIFNAIVLKVHVTSQMGYMISKLSSNLECLVQKQSRNDMNWMAGTQLQKQASWSSLYQAALLHYKDWDSVAHVLQQAAFWFAWVFKKKSFKHVFSRLFYGKENEAGSPKTPKSINGKVCLVKLNGTYHHCGRIISQSLHLGFHPLTVNRNKEEKLKGLGLPLS